MTPQRELGTAVVACLGGAAVAIYGATRVWSVQVTERPGLTSLRATTTGAAHQPWLIGLALVALAGAGALLATRGLARRGLGVVLALVGAGLVVAAITGRASLDAGAAGAAATFWPIAGAAGGALVAWGGQAAARHGHRWPAMGSRYERRPAPPSTTEPAAGQPSPAGPSPSPSPEPASVGAPADGVSPDGVSPDRVSPDRVSPGGGAAADRSADGRVADDRPEAFSPVDARAAWDALDRGDDPT